jgi:hypothetical protein
MIEAQFESVHGRTASLQLLIKEYGATHGRLYLLLAVSNLISTALSKMVAMIELPDIIKLLTVERSNTRYMAPISIKKPLVAFDNL